MISVILFMNQKGDILIHRVYRDDVPRSIAEEFRTKIISVKDKKGTPVRVFDNSSFFHIRCGSVYVVAVTKSNVNAFMVFSFLFNCVNIFKSYFGGTFDEEAIRNNFVLIYELLDEMMDYGYPQNCDPDVLRAVVTQQGIKSEIKDITIQATGAISWRRPGIKYRKNELYIDVVENVNLLMSATGTVLRQDVTGQILLKCFLSGMPECQFGLNDKLRMDKEKISNPKTTRSLAGIEIDDCQFHQCVRLSQFDSDRTISFVPPDGEFELMRYRISDDIHLPFKIKPAVKEWGTESSLGSTRLEITVNVKSAFNAKLYALDVKIHIPVPKNTARCLITNSLGTAKYDAEKSEIIWKIKKFQGEEEHTISAEVNLSAQIQAKAWSRPPISMDFQVPMFTASGLHVRFLKVHEKSDYQTVKWVRYMTKSSTTTGATGVTTGVGAASGYQCRI